MEKIFINKTVVANTFAQITKQYQGRCDIYIQEILLHIDDLSAAKYAADEHIAIQIGSTSQSAITKIDPNTPIILDKMSLTSVGEVKCYIHFKPKKAVRITLGEDGILYIGIIAPDTTWSGWILISKHEKPDMRYYLK